MTRFRVVTYNVHGTVGLDGARRPERVLEVLRQIDADCVALQEFVNWRATGDTDLLHRWGEALGLPHYHFIPAFERGGHWFGNALLSRYGVKRCTEHDFTAPGARPRRALHALLELPRRDLHVTVVHLGLRAKSRIVQRALLWQLVEACGSDAHLMLGDFNEWHAWNPTFRKLKSRYAGGPARPTFPAFSPALALDRIFVYPQRALLDVQVHAHPPARIASDHLPLVATIQLDGGTT